MGASAWGLGSGEALNEHILGDRWPGADERLEMLEEAVDVIRTLWRGDVCDHRGDHCRVEHARIYDLPESSPPIVISGFGRKSVELAARIGDGYCTVGPDGDSVALFRSLTEKGKLVQGGLKVCWGEDEARSRELVARLWPNEGLPGELAQILPTPEHFEQASTLVTEDALAGETPCGPDVERHLAAINAYAEAGFDEQHREVVGRYDIRDFQVLDVIGDGRQAAVEVSIHNVTPVGRELRDEELHVWTFDDAGKVMRLRHYVDTAKHAAAHHD